VRIPRNGVVLTFRSCWQHFTFTTNCMAVSLFTSGIKELLTYLA